jgi:hypothetical protein
MNAIGARKRGRRRTVHQSLRIVGVDDVDAFAHQTARQAYGQGRIEAGSALGRVVGRGASGLERRRHRAVRVVAQRVDQHAVSGGELLPGKIESDAFLPTHAEGRQHVGDSEVIHRPSPRSMT